jgi:hypothetical protein
MCRGQGVVLWKVLRKDVGEGEVEEDGERRVACRVK